MSNNTCILSIETSGELCSTALSIDCKLIAEYNISGSNIHDKLLAENVRRITSDHDISIDEIDAIAVSAGPGSFTGLRIGASLAKGICFEDKPKLIAVPTLSALAYTAIKAAQLLNAPKIAAIIPSHKDLVYYQEFDIQASPLRDILHLPVSDIKLDDDTFICGSNLIGHKYSLEEFSVTTAGHIVKYAEVMYRKGNFIKSVDFTPLYVQEFVPKKAKKELYI